MENHKSKWFIGQNELDIGRGIEAMLLGILMMVVRVLHTFWAFMAGWKALKELVFFRGERETSATKFARPLTYFSVTWIFYVITFSDKFKSSETLVSLGELSSELLPKTLWTLLVKYLEAFAILCNFVAENVVSGEVWKLVIGLIPILGIVSLLTVSSILSFRICRTSIVPREHLAITCYALGTVLLIDFVYGIAGGYIQGLPHMLLTLVFLLVVFPLVFYRWIALIRCSANTSRKRLFAILLVNVCVLIAFSIMLTIVFYAVV